MIKKTILIACLCVFANANLNVKIQNILGYSKYNTHRNLINHIFSNSNAFYSNGKVNYSQVSLQLQNNGLLNLDFGSTRSLDLTFYVHGNVKKSIKNLNDILKSLGYQHFITKKETVVDNTFKWSISLESTSAISPLRLANELESIDSTILDIKKEGKYKWSYSIDMSNASIYKAEDLINNVQLNLRKSLKPYIVKVANISKINISSNSGTSWYPNVIFYDNEFNIIETYTDYTLQKVAKLDVPYNTRYIKIDDLYTLANLKRGFNITKE